MSTVSIRQQMRALVDQFETGLLEQDEYRRLRTSLLERAAQGEYEAPEVSNVTRPRQPTKDKLKAPPPRKKPEPTPSRADVTPARDKTSGGAGKWIVIGALGVALAVGAWWLSQDQGEPSVEQASAVLESPSAMGPMEDLVTQFVQVDDWTLRVIREFSLSWQDFTPDQRQQAESSIWYRRFVRELRDRLRLAELASDSVANDRATAISTLAAEMGIEVESRFADTRNVSAVKAAAEANNRAIAERQRQEKLRLEQEAEQQRLVEEQKQAEALIAQEKAEAAADTPASEPAVSSAFPAKTVEPPGEVATSESIVPTAETSTEDQPPVPEADAVAEVTGDATPPPDAVDDSAEVKSVVDTPEPEVAAIEVEESPPPVQTDKAAVSEVSTQQDSGCSASMLATRTRFCRDAMSDSTSAPKLALVRQGSFSMGSSNNATERPVRTVTLANGFAIGATEVTAKEYARFCKDAGTYCPDNPWRLDSFPVVNVNHEDAVAYTRWLSAQTGQTYRLPTEAEWEYATRAGSDTEYPFGDELSSRHAHYSILRRQSQPLPANSGRPVPNKFGLKHSVGNVSEWVEDAWHDDYTGAPVNGEAFGSASDGQGVVRGGSFADGPAALRSAARSAKEKDTRDRRIGFRILRELD